MIVLLILSYSESYKLVPECFGAVIYEATNLNTLEDCVSGCKTRDDCRFISYRYSKRCFLKSGLINVCIGCDTNGYCANEGSCNIDNEYCSVNVHQNEGTLFNTTLIVWH